MSNGWYDGGPQGGAPAPPSGFSKKKTAKKAKKAKAKRKSKKTARKAKRRK